MGPANVWILGGYQSDFARNLTREGHDFADLTAEVVDFTLRVDCTKEDEPLVQQVLDELHRRPLDVQPSAEGADRLVDCAITHHLEPLDGLSAIVREQGWASDATRARLALHLDDLHHAELIEASSPDVGKPSWSDYYAERGLETRAAAARVSLLQWRGLCSANEVCTRARKEIVLASPRALSITFARDGGDEVPPYVEIYVDDNRIAEGEVANERTFELGNGAAGVHRIMVRVANPFTRNLVQRKLRIQAENL